MEKNALNLPVFTWKDSPDLKPGKNMHNILSVQI